MNNSQGTTDSKKRKLPQTTISSFFSADSAKSSKKFHKNENLPFNGDDMIELKKDIPTVSDQKKEEVKQSKFAKKEEVKKVPASKGKEESKGNDLQDLLNFKLEEYKSIEEFDALFARIADELMNRYMMTINYHYKYRVSEIEFYLNDSNVHPDTFTHGDEMQKLAGQWYFHKFGKTYKVGTYKGMDLTFGKGDKAFGGILIRAITSIGASEGKHLPPNDFIEGPCNTVNKILEHNSDASTTFKEVKEFAVLKDFSTDAFNKASRLYLSKIAGDQPKLDQKVLYRCPRVGLTLKRFDEQKCKFWMADYRFLLFPDKHKKMKELIIINLLKQKKSIADIVKESKCQKATAENLQKEFDKGQKDEKKKIADFKDTDMKGADFAYAYGIHYKKL